jgi:hypothetical protein
VALWGPEHLVGTNSAPNDMSFSGGDTLAVLEGCPTICGPRHFEDAAGSLDALHPKTRSERTRSEVLHEQNDCGQKGRLLTSRERVEVGPEAGQPRKGRHAASVLSPSPWISCAVP